MQRESFSWLLFCLWTKHIFQCDVAWHPCVWAPYSTYTLDMQLTAHIMQVTKGPSKNFYRIVLHSSYYPCFEFTVHTLHAWFIYTHLSHTACGFTTCMILQCFPGCDLFWEHLLTEFIEGGTPMATLKVNMYTISVYNFCVDHIQKFTIDCIRTRALSVRCICPYLTFAWPSW